MIHFAAGETPCWCGRWPKNCPHQKRPSNDERGFIHKRLIGGIVGGVGGLLGGGPAGAIGGAVSGFLGGGDKTVPGGVAAACPPGFSMSATGCIPTRTRAEVAARFGPFPIPGAPTLLPVAAPQERQPTAAQKQIRTELGHPPEQLGFGDAVMGRFGPGLEPALRTTNIRVCPRGSVLGQDGLCYNKRDLRNSERFWPRGRRPLLTGGEMRAISIAASAAKKMQKKQKQLISLGLMKPVTKTVTKQIPAVHVKTAPVTHA